jgi:glycosyltransferase involved in cell wall biosynthesis
MHVTLVIPALNEEATIAQVVEGICSALAQAGHQVAAVVGDNGSSDATAEVARRAGARVVLQERPGYGSACLKALADLPRETEAVLFADGDGADDPEDAPRLIACLEEGADFALGSRALGEKLGWAEAHSLTPPQRLGNGLAVFLLRLLFGYSFTDLGPYRAIRADALAALAMDDPDYGWTIQMQARAARANLRVREIPVHHRRRRGGESKVSGTLRGSAMAGWVILKTVFAERLVHFRKGPISR